MAKIALHLITGFLGSGKTSLLSAYLQVNEAKNTAFIINEFGELAFDKRIISQFLYAKEEILYFNSGCLCCHKRLDLIFSLKKLVNDYEQRGEKLEKIIIESTGVANVAPILYTISNDSFLSHHFTLQSVISCVDSINAHLHLQNEEARAQIIASDMVIITKTDVQKMSIELENTLKNLNPSLKIIDKKQLDYKKLFDFSFKLELKAYESKAQHQAFKNLALSFDSKLDWSAFSLWLSMLLHKYGNNILRIKGIIDTGADFLINFNAVGHLIHPPTHIKKDRTKSELLFITKDLETEKIVASLRVFEKFLKSKITIL